MILTIL